MSSSRQNTRENTTINDANNANNSIHLVNNANNIDRITRIITPQVTNNQFIKEFFNGANFYDNDDLESLILSTEFSGTSSLFP
jgi:hypothetical protein